ncbi:MAG: 2-oxoacid:acceptor oxidoreductase family protein [Acidimicrobiales bacterium]
MFQVRVHGRGGQGVVTAAELLSLAAFIDGRQAQAFPSFGLERIGAPVVAYCRVADGPIRAREPVVSPDALIVQDLTLLSLQEVWKGASPATYVLLNSPKPWRELAGAELLSGFDPSRVVAAPATEIALAQVGRPVSYAALLGGFAALTGVVSLSAVSQAIRQRFSGLAGERNVAAAAEAFRLVDLARNSSSWAV